MNARDQEFAELLDKIGHNVVHISSINEREWVPHFWCRNCNVHFSATKRNIRGSI